MEAEIAKTELELAKGLAAPAFSLPAYEPRITDDDDASIME